MSNDQINYSALIDAAMRGVVRDVLRGVEKNGLPGDHHFYITFNTNDAGVQISEALKARYPHEMTVVLQHQFWDFKVDDKMFQVTLSFGGLPEKLVIPYASMTAFADPSIKFGLQFYHAQPKQGQMPEMLTDYSADIIDDAEEAMSAAKALSAEIISLDSFRKK